MKPFWTEYLKKCCINLDFQKESIQNQVSSRSGLGHQPISAQYSPVRHVTWHQMGSINSWLWSPLLWKLDSKISFICREAKGWAKFVCYKRPLTISKIFTSWWWIMTEFPTIPKPISIIKLFLHFDKIQSNLYRFDWPCYSQQSKASVAIVCRVVGGIYYLL